MIDCVKYISVKFNYSSSIETVMCCHIANRLTSQIDLHVD